MRQILQLRLECSESCFRNQRRPLTRSRDDAIARGQKLGRGQSQNLSNPLRILWQGKMNGSGVPLRLMPKQNAGVRHLMHQRCQEMHRLLIERVGQQLHALNVRAERSTREI